MDKRNLKKIFIIFIVITFLALYSHFFCTQQNAGVSCSGLFGGLVELFLNILMWGVIFFAMTFWFWIPLLLFINRKNKK